MSIQNKAMLVTLSVSCWTARKQDKRVSAEVEASHNAKDAGRYNKDLVSKAHLDPLTQYASLIRAYHYKMTLPWMDNGARLLPSKLFMEYSAELRTMKQEYANRVSTFVQAYPSRVQEARQRLGTMFQPDDYPEASELYGKFDVELDIMPVPNGADFRVDVGDAERARIASDISERVAKRQGAALRSAWDRVRESVGRVSSCLSSPKARIFDSLTGNLEDLVRILPGLNIGEDADMERVCERIVNSLIVDPERLRKSAALRSKVCAEADAILQLCPT
jgi:hypothetical protein